MRKNISRISKDVITLDQKLSSQAKAQSVYLISYLRNLLLKELEAQKNPREELKDQFIIANVGSNDKYLLSKLRDYGVTVTKIDSYLMKLNADNLGSIIGWEKQEEVRQQQMNQQPL